MTKLKQFLVVVLILALITGGLGVGIKRVNAGSTKTPLPNFVTSRIIVLNSNLDLSKPNFGIITRIGNGYLGIAMDSRGDRIIKTDMVLFSSHVPDGLKISQGVLVDIRQRNAYVYIAEKTPIRSVTWLDISAWNRATQRIDSQDLVMGKVINVRQTKAKETETDYCSNPPVVKIWYYVEIEVSTEDSKPTMKIGLNVPKSNLSQVLTLKDNYIWLDLNTQQIYFLEQD